MRLRVFDRRRRKLSIGVILPACSIRTQRTAADTEKSRHRIDLVNQQFVRITRLRGMSIYGMGVLRAEQKSKSSATSLASPRNVRYRVRNGKHLLAASISDFDPIQTFVNSSDLSVQQRPGSTLLGC